MQPLSSLTWPKFGLGKGTLASLGRKSSVPELVRLLDVMSETESMLIDTADSYGSGDCEILIGKALRCHGESCKLITKAGYRCATMPGLLRPLNQFAKKVMQRLGDRQRFAPDYLIRTLEGSLSRLQVPMVDAFLLHDPGLETLHNDDVLKACQSLRQSGKAACLGVSSANPAVVRAAIDLGVFSVIQTPANIAVFNSLHESWARCANNGIHVIGNHVLAPNCLQLPTMNHETLLRACASYLPVNSTILCGTRKPSHLKQSANWAHEVMPGEDANALVHRFFPRGDETHSTRF